MIEIEFERGTLTVVTDKKYAYLVHSASYCKWDIRTKCFRLPAFYYYHFLTSLYRANAPYHDKAKKYSELSLRWKSRHSPFPYQNEAIENWIKKGKRGYVVLPTGTGKSFLGMLAIAAAARSTLVLVPTIDLMHQWYDSIESYFDGVEVGLIGGGYYEPKAITIITYSSAYRHLEQLGNQFGLMIFDECHHLPGASYRLAAEFSIAPFRIGLSATPERNDGGHNALKELIGPCIFRKSITEMSGEYLAEYDIVQITTELSKTEREEYKRNRELYLSFLRDKGLRLGAGDWQRFIWMSSISKRGREAFRAYLRQKEIALATPGKIKQLEYLIKKHRRQRTIIFTHDNATAYKIADKFLVPIITHQTKAKERREYLVGFNEGKYKVLVTSKVLNEGVNIPAANIGIILSGSGSVREHVQRLGRILRKYRDKKAILYEVVAGDTAEEYTSQRRRDHEAYHRGKK